ncbi:MAG: glutamine--fructose-6-phosphate transaminase (isomerizing) [Coriobacteriales bacterium]|jgi:glucosamine--fructose-6-phosphate aminotransferase (isomerizing)|nr:glutamine--fructose-6-phosphate transaminase (isomerizing) [Coriobacteriales bacterium]
MCGIVAYTGANSALPVLISGLKRLEYRGYDSAGVSLLDDDGIVTVKTAGKVSDLEKELADLSEDIRLTSATCGIAHTRWATHGTPCTANAHPHSGCKGRFAIVHNGIIENYLALRQALEDQGHHFRSDTDSEVVAHLLEQAAGLDPNADSAALVKTILPKLQGSYALAILDRDSAGRVFCVCHDSPLVVAADGSMAASDLPALICAGVNEVVYLPDDQLVGLGRPLTGFTIKRIDTDLTEAEHSGFPDFMLKEIYEQPAVAKYAMRNDFSNLDLNTRDIRRVYVVACGTSYHAGLIGRDLIEKWAQLPVDARVASEFRYGNPYMDEHTLVIALTQSGETADTLEAAKLARSRGAKVLALTNVLGSRITQVADIVVNIQASLEIAVAATKSYVAQVIVLTKLALYLACARGLLTPAHLTNIEAQMALLPDQIQSLLDQRQTIEQVACQCLNAHTVLYIGRGVGATTCLEGALKLKEISYVHAEAFYAGEIKHGPIALIDPIGVTDKVKATPVIAVACAQATYDKMISNIEEVQARGAKVIAIASEGDEHIAELTPHVIYIPHTSECLMPVLAAIPMQLIARYIAVEHGQNVDQPRNLAKSVTVE